MMIKTKLALGVALMMTLMACSDDSASQQLQASQAKSQAEMEVEVEMPSDEEILESVEQELVEEVGETAAEVTPESVAAMMVGTWRTECDSEPTGSTMVISEFTPDPNNASAVYNTYTAVYVYDNSTCSGDGRLYFEEYGSYYPEGYLAIWTYLSTSQSGEYIDGLGDGSIRVERRSIQQNGNDRVFTDFISPDGNKVKFMNSKGEEMIIMKIK